MLFTLLIPTSPPSPCFLFRSFVPSKPVLCPPKSLPKSAPSPHRPHNSYTFVFSPSLTFVLDLSDGTKWATWRLGTPARPTPIDAADDLRIQVT